MIGWLPLHWRDQKDISTQETLSPARPWLPAPDEHSGWGTGASQSPPKRPRAAGLLAAIRDAGSRVAGGARSVWRDDCGGGGAPTSSRRASAGGFRIGSTVW